MLIYDVQEKIFVLLNHAFPGMVFDFVPEQTKLPYIVFEEAESENFETKTWKGESITLHVLVWSQAKGRFEVADMMRKIEMLVDEVDLDNHVVSNRIIKRKITPTDGYYQGELTINIKVQRSED